MLGSAPVSLIGRRDAEAAVSGGVQEEEMVRLPDGGAERVMSDLGLSLVWDGRRGGEDGRGSSLGAERVRDAVMVLAI